MADIIKLLPDAVANQIAAGEVIQRPASAVKELLENAIDAGSTDVTLNIKDAGRTLIQVIDNGQGMSATDARMCFERHATSKIKHPDDLFKILTMGFRGEAMPSIASVAQVELKTRTHEAEMGTQVIIEGYEFKSQTPVATPIGTNISVKNLFFNVPARRNFLKSDPVEIRHVIDEFLRVALANPNVGLSMYSNGNDVFKLPAGSLINRLTGVFGTKYNEKVVKLEEHTDWLTISGYIGKPEFARKTRGEQYMYVNKRFIKSPFLQHAVQTAFEELISRDNYPSYFIYFEIDPAKIDVNIHPTKTEIKFDDERAVYAMLKATVKNALGKFSLTPSLDFEQEMGFTIPPITQKTTVYQPTINVNPHYNPFDTKPQTPPVERQREAKNQRHWEVLMPSREANNQLELPITPATPSNQPEGLENKQSLFQLQNTYVVSPLKTGLLVIHQQYAHERVLYEGYLFSMARREAMAQQELFAQQLTLNPAAAETLRSLLDELKYTGFDIADIGGNTFAISGHPPQLEAQNLQAIVEGMVNVYQQNEQALKPSLNDNIARSLARSMAVKAGQALTLPEMQHLVDSLFACEHPYTSPYGKPTTYTLPTADIEKRFTDL